MINLDVRGFSCPIPLMKVREALAQAQAVEVLTDDPCALENIRKYAKSQSCRVTETEINNIETKILIEKV
jgi:TusA-related sulfurtransferase